MLAVKNRRSLPQSFFQVVLALLAVLRERRQRAQFQQEMQRLDPHLLADIGFRLTEGQELVSLESDRANANIALVNSHRRQARLKTAFLARRRQLLRNGRSGP
ncbi:DUF1127 domain-containing protein [Eionea flava]